MTVRVVFTRRRTLGSLLLRTALWSPWSHCALVNAYGCWALEATPHGVRVRPLGSLLQEASKWEIVEVPGDPQAVWDAAYRQIGKPYDWLGVLGIGARRRWQSDRRWFCSELVAWAFERAGTPLFRMKTWRITPRDVYLPRFLRDTVSAATLPESTLS